MPQIGVSTKKLLYSEPNYLAVMRMMRDGVALDEIEAQLVTPNDEIGDLHGRVFLTSGTQRVARITSPGAPSVAGVEEQEEERTFKCIYSDEFSLWNPFENMHLIDPASNRADQISLRALRRQIQFYTTRKQMLRATAALRILMQGVLYWDGKGNLLPSSSGAKGSYDPQQDVRNTGVGVDEFGSAILQANWTSTAGDIAGDIQRLVETSVQRFGGQIATIYYGRNIFKYLVANNAVNAFLKSNNQLSTAMTANELPNGLLGVTRWKRGSKSMFRTADGTAVRNIGDNDIVAIPEVSPDWWRMVEGSYPVVADDSAGTIEQAMNKLEMRTGMSMVPELSKNPAGLNIYYRDAFACIPAPTAWYRLTVPLT